MERSAQRILTTHAGSLPRGPELQSLHARRFAGEAIDEAALTAVADTAMRDTVAKQIEAGLDVVNNGEVGRESFFTYVRHRMTGFGGTSQRPVMADLTRYPGFFQWLTRVALRDDRVNLLQAPRAIGDVAYVDRVAIDDECARLAAALAPHRGRYVEAFVSSPSPGIVAAAMQNDHYPDLDAYVDAVAAALRHEYAAIVEHGFVLQIDAPDLAMERHTLFQGRPIEDFLAFVRVVVAALNRSLEGLPRDRVRLHVCWGNYEGPHDCDVPLEEIWSEIREARVGGVLLSMANPRHEHEWRLFEDGSLPEGWLLIPGVIDTTTNYVEHPRAVADRIERVARAVGDPSRVLAGTDCGFETASGLGTVAADVVWQKLRSLSEGAAIASHRLWK
nr:vitamin-B12 independent putative methionine synthase [uncultured bacterium]